MSSCETTAERKSKQKEGLHIPAAVITAELSAKGVRFTMDPTDVGPSIIAVFDDTGGNLIQLVPLKR